MSPRSVPGSIASGIVDDLRLGVDQREDALAGGDGLLHLGVDAGHLLDREEHEDDVGDEGLDAADGDRRPARPGEACTGVRCRR